MNGFLKSSINFAAQNPDLILCLTKLATELHSSGKEYEREVTKIYGKFYKFVSDILEEGKQDGSFRSDIDPRVVAISLIG